MICGTFQKRGELAELEWDEGAKHWERIPVDKELLRQLSRRSSWNGIWRISLFLLYLGIPGYSAYAVSQISIWLSIPLFYLYFGVYGFWVAIAHEQQHDTVFGKNMDGFNKLLFFIIQCLMWNSPRYAKISHRLHHRYTMVRGIDPETAWPEVMDLPFLRKIVGNMVLNILLIKAPLSLLQALWTQAKRSLGAKDRMMREHCSDKDIVVIRLESLCYLLIHSGIIFCAVYFGWWYLLLYISFAWQIGAPIEAIWHNTEHIGKVYNCKNQIYCTRSVKVSWLLHPIYWGLDDHIDHHMYPAVPSYNLPKLHVVLKDQLPEPKSALACWGEMFAIAKQKSQNARLEFLPDLPQKGAPKGPNTP